ncbi:MAG TPA: hypothetical protein VLJ88_08695 [Propionibacteriaceae bacterium]|nr:hypothetical protein [Propionibacteriaceae bacterium]
MNEQTPLPIGQAFRAVAGCVASSTRLLIRRQVHMPTRHVDERLAFADGSTARVYFETVIDRPATQDPALLFVGFRLRGLRGARAHALFRFESRFNTPLFVGFPGFVSKLWLANDSNGIYRGVYQWDGPDLAENYARALWRVLALVSVAGSIQYQVLPGLRRDDVLRQPQLLNTYHGHEWWRPVQPLAALA